MAFAITAPVGRTYFQKITLPSITYATGYSVADADEILITNLLPDQLGYFTFLKRYSTWFLYTNITDPLTFPLKITYIKYNTSTSTTYSIQDSVTFTSGTP